MSASPKGAQRAEGSRSSWGGPKGAQRAEGSRSAWGGSAALRQGLRLGLALALLAFAPLAAAPAPARASQGYAFELSNELMSPFCPGRTLADCPSGEADSLRLWIQVQEAAGRARASVEAELLARYGDVLLSAPRARGIGVAAYAVPALAFLAGGALLFAFLRRQTRRAAAQGESAAPTASAPADPELERLLDRELEG